MPDDDEIRLTLPADADLAPVVVAALGALARGAGLSGEAVTWVRERADEGYQRIIERGTGADVEVVASVQGREIRFELRREGWTDTAHKRWDAPS